MNPFTLRTESRQRHGHGSLLNEGAVAVPDVGYWIIENWQDRALSGYVRGDAHALTWFSSIGQELLLVLEDGWRLPIVLTRRNTDNLTWEFQASGKAHWTTS